LQKRLQVAFDQWSMAMYCGVTWPYSLAVGNQGFDGVASDVHQVSLGSRGIAYVDHPELTYVC
jgi:hypothetical protein